MIPILLCSDDGPAGRACGLQSCPFRQRVSPKKKHPEKPGQQTTQYNSSEGGENF